jgi:hypothetical protein
MKAKVTFEKLGSSLPKPIFLAGPPYKARQGAVVRGSNSYHYCQIRAQSDCDGNFEKLVRFLLDNSWVQSLCAVSIIFLWLVNLNCYRLEWLKLVE